MSVTKRGKGWAVKVYRPGNKQEWVGTFQSKREALRAEREALSSPRAMKDETCGSFAARWVECYPRPRESTNKTNSYAVAGFANDPRLKNLRLNDLDKPTARQWAAGKPAGTRDALRAMFSDAVNDGLCVRNPFSNLRLPRSQGRKNTKPLKREAVEKLADVALKEQGEFGKQFRAMILFAAFTTMRPGEIFVLGWSDLDFENGLISVTKTLSGGSRIEKPKNGKTREIVLPPPVIEALLDVPRVPGQDRIFSTVSGRRFSKGSLRYCWDPVRRAFGNPEMDFYELRHFGAHYLLEELRMTPADVAVQLGHTDGGALVMSTYGHPSDENARDRIRKAWGEEKAKPALTLVS